MVYAVTIALVVVGLMASPVCANHEVFMVGTMRNVDPSGDSITSVSGACVPTHNRQRLECYFTGFSLARAHSDEEIRERRDQIEEFFKADAAGAINDLKKSFCNEPNALNPDPVRLKYSAGMRTSFAASKTFCDSPSAESAMELFKAIGDVRAKTCRCIVRDWRATFIRQIDLWVSNNGPDGLCGVIKVFTLTPHELKKMKSEDSLGPLLWRLDEKTIVTRARKAGCTHRQVKDRSISLSWDGPSKSLECSEFEFSSELDGMSSPARR